MVQKIEQVFKAIKLSIMKIILNITNNFVIQKYYFGMLKMSLAYVKVIYYNIYF